MIRNTETKKAQVTERPTCADGHTWVGYGENERCAFCDAERRTPECASSYNGRHTIIIVEDAGEPMIIGGAYYDPPRELKYCVSCRKVIDD